MAEAGPGDAGGYVAFISYSHKDAAVGRWLHRRLEGYRLPRRLAGTEGEHGTVPARLTPIFRDRDELPAAGDLSEKVRAALAISRNLIVVCSPHSAASPWVAKEIATFRDLHPDRPIFTAIVEGEPDQCFPPVLREGGVEPLAADLRKEGDGRRLGLLKLVAGLAGVGLDALVQRDAARRVRRVTYVTAAAVTAMLVMALLTTFALNARREADRQRAQAEGLVEFMLTDLRKKLRRVGRLPIMTEVNERALNYYRTQDVRRLPPESLERRARILHAMGEDDQARGSYDQALAQFQEAARTTAELLAQEPNEPRRIYAHAQSEFWLGSMAFTKKDQQSANRSFERYRALAQHLISVDGEKPEWLKEAGYAEGSLCAVALRPPPRLRDALRSCATSLNYMKRAVGARPDTESALDLANRHGWLADAYRMSGNWTAAAAERRAQQQILEPLVAGDPLDMNVRERWMLLQISLADLYAPKDAGKAWISLHKARTAVDGMINVDPSNAELRKRRADILRRIQSIQSQRRTKWPTKF
ncbi:MAG TPA: toll/interleukin-1 receptor domain-containing protein [Allosphingosinicella sp.]|nr:toll/interleukin-1 receptor domain-containing protein [Allosphingosinicella sp.]